MNERIRVAVVGGGVGRGHIEAYKSLPDRYEVVAFCDINAERAAELAAAYNIPRAVTSLDEVCAMDDIEIIDLATPPHLHLSQILQTLEAGKMAICEKPLVGSLKQVDELIEAEKRTGQRVMPIFQYRYGHGLQKLKILIDTGIAGNAYLGTVEVAWRRKSEYYAIPWRGTWAGEMGGSLLSHAIHAIDMLTYALGPVKNVFARTTTRVNKIEVEDCASVSFEMADGSLASIGVTLGSPEQITRHRFSFSGFVAESNTQPYENSADPWTFTADTPELAEQIEAALADFTPLPERFAGQFYRLSEALRNNTELPVTLADARASLELITAMYASGRTNQAIELPLGPEHPNYTSWLPS